MGLVARRLGPARYPPSRDQRSGRTPEEARPTDARGRTGRETEQNRSHHALRHFPAREGSLDSTGASDLVLVCGAAIGFANSFIHLGSILHRDFSDHRDVNARVKNSSQAFGALRDRVFSSKDLPERKVFNGGVLAVLLSG